jgi:hypothetical protein
MDRLKQLNLIREARKLLSDPAGWTKGAYFIDAEGRMLDYDDFDPEMVCGRCALGALIEACVIEDPAQDRRDALECGMNLKDLIEEKAPALFIGPDRLYLGLVAYNDRKSRTHAEVLALFDTAIASLEAEGLTDVEGSGDEGL